MGPGAELPVITDEAIDDGTEILPHGFAQKSTGVVRFVPDSGLQPTVVVNVGSVGLPVQETPEYSINDGNPSQLTNTDAYSPIVLAGNSLAL